MPIGGSRLVASGAAPPPLPARRHHQQPMAVSLGSLGANHSSGGAYYVPAWRYLHQQQQQQQRHQQHGSSHGRQVASASPPPPPPPPALPATDQMFSVSKSRLPTDMPRDPRLWSRDDVRKWLLWCQEEFDLPPIDVNQFPMNGKALCLLMKPDFNDRAPRAGDVLYNAVHLLLLNASMNEESHKQRYDQQMRMYSYSGGSLLNTESNSSPHSWATAWPFVSSDYHSAGQVALQSSSRFDLHANGGGVDSTVTLSPAPSTDSQSGSPRRGDDLLPGTVGGRGSSDDGSPVDLQRHRPASAHNSDSGESDSGCPTPVPLSLTKNKHPHIPQITKDNIPGENVSSVMEQPVTNGRLLWDFLHQLLNDPGQRYSSCIAWKEHETGVFKIVDPHGLAQLWGMQKNHLNMNFDKMSRALRYYYRVNILKKVQGERHCYQFLRQPMELKACKQRALLNKYCGLQTKHAEQTTRPSPIKCEQENV